jgi:hypothetical protein
MTTDRINLKTVEEFMNGYTPIYKPIYPLFLGKSQQYTMDVGKINFNTVEAVSDLRMKTVTPKDSELRSIAAHNRTATFKKYFLANQFRQSTLQDIGDIEGVVSQVLDENQKLMDDLLLLGEGTSASTMINNGLFWSNDTNYVLESSTELKKADYLSSLHTAVTTNAATADAVAGRKILIVYGSTVLAKLNSLYSTSQKAVKAALAEVLGADYSIIQLPAACTPAGTAGWIIANLDQCKLHFTALPQLKDQGVNGEGMYTWHNFLMGSCMLQPLVYGAIVRQPATLEA